MKKYFLLVICLFPCFLFAQQKHTLSGYIFEQGSKETLPGVTIYLPHYNTSTFSNAYGFYSITYPATDVITVIYSYMGFSIDTVVLTSLTQLSFNKEMNKTMVLPTIQVVSEKKSIETTQMSSHLITAMEIKSIPMLFGEKDLFKTLMLMPGVSSGTEGTSGIHVRGGSPDQNLIILDEATIYNANHLLSFFSIFNGDAIKTAELIKGGFPARYGGRLSSVIDIKMKEGNKQSYHGEGGLGLISGHFMVEGPIVKNKSSFMLSGRRTWFDILSRPIVASMMPGYSIGYYFYDLNAKFNYDFGDKDKLFVSGYFGRDKFYMRIKEKSDEGSQKIISDMYWQNGIATIRWNHLFFNKLFSNMSFVFSDYTMTMLQEYDFRADNEKNYFSYKSNSGIRDYTLKYDLSYIPNAMNTILMGAIITYHEARPSAMQTKMMDTITHKNTILAQGLECALYAEDEINIKEKLKINPGVRLNIFTVPQKTYVLPEPRLSINYNFHKEMSLKASYAMMHQYMILLSSTTIGMPNDLWVPVTKNIRPQRSQQVALGWVYEPAKIKMLFSVEGFYKKMNHIIGYKQGASFLFDEWLNTEEDNHKQKIDWESQVTSGQGWAYGIELLARKSAGKFSGWIAYTLSWSQQQFDELNFGKKFYARYDRRHDISLVLKYDPTKRINISLAWVFASGNYLTFPTDTYLTQGLQEHLLINANLPEDVYIPDIQYIDNYAFKNNFKAEPFHHLDIGVQFIKPHKKRKNFESIVEVSIYNVYCHKNPFFYFVIPSEQTDENGNSKHINRLVKITVFPIIPSLSYSFRF